MASTQELLVAGAFVGDALAEGPAAVREDGLYAETRQFVANVLALRGRV